jgi:hypothetical protein
MKEVFGRLIRAFPDLHIAVEDLIAEGDKVVNRNTVTGTHQGEHMGIPPTGKCIAYNEIFIIRFEGGRIAETWGASTSSPSCDSSAPFPQAPHDHSNAGFWVARAMSIRTTRRLRRGPDICASEASLRTSIGRPRGWARLVAPLSRAGAAVPRCARRSRASRGPVGRRSPGPERPSRPGCRIASRGKGT